MTREIPLLPFEVELALIAGFHDPHRVPGHGERKLLAKRIRIRLAAVTLAEGSGLRSPMRDVARAANVSERNLHQMFASKEALFSFPPPEFAVALVASSAGSPTWGEAIERAYVLFEQLDGNDGGRKPMAGLARLHEQHSVVRSSDGYFAEELRSELSKLNGPLNAQARSLVPFMTEVIRSSFVVWSSEPARPLRYVWELLNERLEEIHSSAESAGLATEKRAVRKTSKAAGNGTAAKLEPLS